MYRQKSYEKQDKGTLFIVATPIGNLGDMTFRAIETLRTVAAIAAEDTRQTMKLLRHFEITTPMMSYHEHNSKERESEILNLLHAGKSVALVSDAGLPAISDPGQPLVARSIAANIAVVPIPGVNAALSALVVSGLPTDSFTFIGFLPREHKKRVEQLELYRDRQDTLIMYEAPHRVKEMLADVKEVFGNRRIVIARELTKRYEELLHGTISEALDILDAEALKGELTLVIEGSTTSAQMEQAWWEGIQIESHIELWMEKGLALKDAIKKVAEERGVPKREIYNAYHQK